MYYVVNVHIYKCTNSKFNIMKHCFWASKDMGILYAAISIATYLAGLLSIKFLLQSSPL